MQKYTSLVPGTLSRRQSYLRTGAPFRKGGRISMLMEMHDAELCSQDQFFSKPQLQAVSPVSCTNIR